MISKLLLLIFTTVMLTLNAQTDFYNDLLQNRHYYDSLISIRGIDSMQGTGYVQYQRWFRYWAPKLMPDEDYDDYQNNILDYAENYSPAGSGNGSNPTWRLIGPNDIPSKVPTTNARGVGQIHYIYKDPFDQSGKTMFACSPVGGLFRSTDDGETWQNAGTDKGLPRSGVSSVVVDSHDPAIWYVTTGNGESYDDHVEWQSSIGLYKTTDAGATWSCVGLDEAGIKGMRKVIEVNSTQNTTLIVTTTSGLYRIDDANTANPTIGLLINGEFYDVVADPVNTNIIYASGSQNTGIYRVDLNTGNYNELFSMSSMPNSKYRRFSLKISSAENDYLYAVFTGRGLENHLYRYRISTDEWVDKGEAPLISGYGRTLGWAIRPKKTGDGKIRIYGRIVNPMYLYYDDLSNNAVGDGIQVTDINETHVDYHYLMVEDNDTIIWAGTDGGVYKGTFVNDNTIQWESKCNGLAVSTIENIDVYHSTNPDSTIITSGQHDCGSNVYLSGDEIQWDIHNLLDGDGFKNDIVNINEFYLSYQSTVFKFLNNNKTKLDITDVKDCANPDITLSPFLNFNTYFERAGNILYGVGPQGVVKSTNNGNWQEWSLFTDNALYDSMGCGRSGVWNITVANDGTKYISTFGSSDDENPYFYHRVYKQSTEDKSDWVLVKNQPVTDKWINAVEVAGNSNQVYVGMRKSNTSNAIYLVHAEDPDNAVWDVLDYDLPNGIVVNCIERGNGRVWIGTDRGVYYLNDGETNWVDYNENLPNVEVKDIRVENNRVYVGTYGRGVWEASAPGCYSSGEVTLSGVIVSPGFTKTYYSDIRILPGTTAYIYGTLKMGAGARIIVERTAKLIVDGGTVTNACPDRWQGIEVWGNSNAAQDIEHQGYLILKNGATLENAEQAAVTVKNDNNVSDLAYAGGVIQADDSHFKNNTYSVMMFPYPMYYPNFALEDNKSYFKNCTFDYDSSYYYFSIYPVTHVNLQDVSGVLFINDVFENNVSLDFAPEGKRGNGITGWNAGFKLVSDPQIPTQNVFNNLDYGVQTFSYTGTHHTIVIDSAIFNHNRTGCYLGAETYATVIRNTFNVTRMDNQLPHGYCGLYLDASTAYQVEENEFYSDYYPQYGNTYSRSYGLVVNNSGPENNFIYNNTFHNLGWATQAQGQNRGVGDPAPGLQYKCNLFVDNWQDISVTWDGPPNLMNGIAENQGSAADTITAPAGNRFSRIGTWDYSDYDNEGESIWYYLPDLTSTMTYPKLVPQSYTTNSITLKNNLYVSWNPTNGCPSHLIEENRNELNVNIVQNEANRAAYADTLDAQTDNGNTTALNLDVVTSMPPETMQLRSQLLDASPYLSDTVMANAAAKEDVLPNSIVTEVLTANPQSAKAENVLNTLNARNNPPSDNQMAAIHANDTVLGAKEKLESKMAFYAARTQQDVNDLVRLNFNDTTLTAVYDSIEAALARVQTPESYYMQAFARFNKGDSAGVWNKLSDVTSDFDLTAYQTTIYSAYEDYFGVLLALKAANKNVTEADSAQKAPLWSIVQNADGLVQAMARNILIKTGDIVYHEPYILPDTNTTKSAKVKVDFNRPFNNNESYVKLYPNPAKEYLTIEYDVPFNANKPVIVINSTNGVQTEAMRLATGWGQKIVDMRDYSPGTYLVRLYINGKVAGTGKIVKF